MSLQTLTVEIPTTGFLREYHLAGRKATAKLPAIQGCLGISKPTLWRWVKAGKFPKPVKLSAKTSAWRAEDVRAWMDERKAAA